MYCRSLTHNSECVLAHQNLTATSPQSLLLLLLLAQAVGMPRAVCVCSAYHKRARASLSNFPNSERPWRIIGQAGFRRAGVRPAGSSGRAGGRCLLGGVSRNGKGGISGISLGLQRGRERTGASSLSVDRGPAPRHNYHRGGRAHHRMASSGTFVLRPAPMSKTR